MEVLPLFIYGTLLDGECNRHLLTDSLQQELPATVSGALHVIEGDSYPYPALLLGSGIARGTLVTMYQESYEERLAVIDRLEDYDVANDTGLYLRRTVEVQTPYGRQSAWTYLWNGPTPSSEPLSDGDFCRWMRTRKVAKVC